MPYKNLVRENETSDLVDENTSIYEASKAGVSIYFRTASKKPAPKRRQ